MSSWKSLSFSSVQSRYDGEIQSGWKMSGELDFHLYNKLFQNDVIKWQNNIVINLTE